MNTIMSFNGPPGAILINIPIMSAVWIEGEPWPGIPKGQHPPWLHRQVARQERGECIAKKTEDDLVWVRIVPNNGEEEQWLNSILRDHFEMSC